MKITKELEGRNLIHRAYKVPDVVVFVGDNLTIMKNKQGFEFPISNRENNYELYTPPPQQKKPSDEILEDMLRNNDGLVLMQKHKEKEENAIFCNRRVDALIRWLDDNWPPKK